MDAQTDIVVTLKKSLTWDILVSNSFTDNENTEILSITYMTTLRHVAPIVKYMID